MKVRTRQSTLKTLIKLILIPIGVILILIGLGAALLAVQGGPMLKEDVEEALSGAFGTKFTIESVRVTPFPGVLEITGLAVINAEPFKAKEAIRFGRIVIDFKPRTLLSRTPTISCITFDETEVYLRYKVTKGTNLTHLATRAVQRSEEAKGDEGRRFIIEEVRCDGAKLKFSGMLSPLAPANMEVAPFSFENPSDEPVTTGQVTAIFMRSLLMEVVTLKGLLRPVGRTMRNETEELQEAIAGE